MKFSKILLILFITVSIVSCKKSDDGPVPFVLSNANITGTHNLTYYTRNEVTTGTVGGATIVITKNTTADTYQARYAFTEAGAYTYTGEYRTTTTSSQGGDPIVAIEVENETGTYQLNDAAKTIITTKEGATLSDVSIVTFFNELELRFTRTTTTVIDGDETVKMEEFRFVRQ
jgi:hypothetical protein